MIKINIKNQNMIIFEKLIWRLFYELDMVSRNKNKMATAADIRNTTLSGELLIKVLRNYNFTHRDPVMDTVVETACYRGDLLVIEYCLGHPYGSDTRMGFILIKSALGNSTNVFKYALDKMSKENKNTHCNHDVDWQWVWEAAGKSGSFAIVRLLMSETGEKTHNFGRAAEAAASHGHLELSKFCYSHTTRLYPEWVRRMHFDHMMMESACQSSSIETIDHYINRATCQNITINWNKLLFNAASGGHQLSIEHIMGLMQKQNIEIDMESGLKGAAVGYHIPTVKYFIERGAVGFRAAYRKMYTNPHDGRDDEYRAVRILLVPEAAQNPYYYYPQGD